MKRLKYKFMWWIAYAIPAQAALYAFVRVHATIGEGPSYDGEYARAYKQFVKQHGLNE